MSEVDPVPPPAATPPAAPSPPRARRWRRRLSLVVAIGLVLGAGYAVGVEPTWLELTTHDLSAGASALRVVHLTDLHVESLGARYAARIQAEVAALRPDLIVITGDTLTARPHRVPVRAARQLLDGFSAPLGVYACLGNHERGALVRASEAYAGVTLLRGRAIDVPGTRLRIAGVDEWFDPLPPAGPGFDLLLCHFPAVLPEAARAGYELVLAGHSHGGQVCLPLFGPPWLPDGCDGYERGWFTQGQTRMYVSKGLGTSILPIRWGARPEIALLLLPR